MAAFLAESWTAPVGSLGNCALEAQVDIRSWPLAVDGAGAVSATWISKSIDRVRWRDGAGRIGRSAGSGRFLQLHISGPAESLPPGHGAYRSAPTKKGVVVSIIARALVVVHNRAFEIPCYHTLAFQCVVHGQKIGSRGPGRSDARDSASARARRGSGVDSWHRLRLVAVVVEFRYRSAESRGVVLGSWSVGHFAGLRRACF